MTSPNNNDSGGYQTSAPPASPVNPYLQHWPGSIQIPLRGSPHSRPASPVNPFLPQWPDSNQVSLNGPPHPRAASPVNMLLPHGPDSTQGLANHALGSRAGSPNNPPQRRGRRGRRMHRATSPGREDSVAASVYSENAENHMQTLFPEYRERERLWKAQMERKTNIVDPADIPLPRSPQYSSECSGSPSPLSWADDSEFETRIAAPRPRPDPFIRPNRDNSSLFVQAETEMRQRISTSPGHPMIGGPNRAVNFITEVPQGRKPSVTKLFDVVQVAKAEKKRKAEEDNGHDQKFKYVCIKCDEVVFMGKFDRVQCIYCGCKTLYKPRTQKRLMVSTD